MNTIQSINKNRLISLFSHLVSIDSPSLGERNMCDEIIRRLEALAIPWEEDNTGEKIDGNAGNLYAYIEGTLNLPPLLFSAHMDTVEPSSGKKAVIASDGKITSAGNTVLGADDLSGVAAILEAITVLKESGLPHRPIELLFDVSEETYCTGIGQFDFSRLHSKEVYVLDLTGSIGSAAFQAPSILSFRAAFQGRSAHAGFSPEKGIHAIQAAARAVTLIECGHIDNTTVNIGTIQGGTADNIVPESCILTGEIRSFSDEAARSRLTLIQNIIEQSAEEAGAAVHFESQTLCLAYCTEQSQPVVERFVNTCTKLGLTPHLQQTYGGSDNNHFVHHGLQGLVIASGMNHCHSCQEYTNVNDLESAAKLTLALMLSKE
ncbi:MAG: M20/M25/M40 family metallo-hydrolase [Lachnospiraceae bacterium]|nr:M20/M25/M40 family metallo-hydrolase [Lachnospiraceae bacterium]